MAVTTEELSGWLDGLGAEHHIDDERIIFGVGNGETNKGVIIELKENGEMFQMYMNLLDNDINIVKITEHEHLHLMLTHLLSMNHRTKFGTWEYNPTDGEIQCAVEIPLEDATMTQKQFERIFEYFVNNVQDGFDEILKILETGELPQKEDSYEELLAMLAALRSDLKAAKASDTNEEDGI